MILMSALLFLLPSYASAEEIFAKLTECPQVESSYVSGKFSRYAPPIRSGYIPAELTQNFSALYTYECYSEEAVKKARKILTSYLTKKPEIETVIRNRHGYEEYSVYQKFNSDNSIAQMIVWSSSSPIACELVVIDWDDTPDSGDGDNNN